MPPLIYTPPSPSHIHSVAFLLITRNPIFGDSLAFIDSFGTTITRAVSSPSIKNFINRKMGTSSDIKPAPAILKDFLFHESDTGSLYLSDGITTTLTQGNNKPETYINKIIDVEQNTLSIPSSTLDQSPFSPNATKLGGIIPAATTTSSFYGILDPNAINIHNPLSIPTSTTSNGLLLEFKALLINSKMGFSTPVPVAHRQDLDEITFDFLNTDNNKMLIGFSSFTSFDLNTVLANNEAGIAIGFTENTANYCVFHNDGLGGSTAIDNFSIPKDKILHRASIKMTTTNIQCTLDSETLTITTQIPALTTDLYLLSYAIY